MVLKRFNNAFDKLYSFVSTNLIRFSLKIVLLRVLFLFRLFFNVKKVYAGCISEFYVEQYNWFCFNSRTKIIKKRRSHISKKVLVINSSLNSWRNKQRYIYNVRSTFDQLCYKSHIKNWDYCHIYTRYNFRLLLDT